MSKRSGEVEDFALTFFRDFLFGSFELVVGFEAFATGALRELASD